MTPAQQAALKWAIDLAEMQASAAFWQAKKSTTAWGRELQRKRADDLTAHADALKALRDGANG